MCSMCTNLSLPIEEVEDMELNSPTKQLDLCFVSHSAEWQKFNDSTLGSPQFLPYSSWVLKGLSGYHSFGWVGIWSSTSSWSHCMHEDLMISCWRVLHVFLSFLALLATPMQCWLSFVALACWDRVFCSGANLYILNPPALRQLEFESWALTICILWGHPFLVLLKAEDPLGWMGEGWIATTEGRKTISIITRYTWTVGRPYSSLHFPSKTPLFSIIPR